MKKLLSITILLITLLQVQARACSVIYYIDKATGKIYVANNEDYYYDVKPYIQTEPAKKGELAHVWYGWDKFAQGGINEAGLFFDGAVTPTQPLPDGYKRPKGNLGRDILAQCKTVDEAITFIKQRKVILPNAHMMLGDSTGNAVVVEWIDNQMRTIPIKDNKLVMTNFLLADTSKGNYPCYRYNAIQKRIAEAEQTTDTISYLQASNFLAPAAQPPQTVNGKTGGTLYSSFINISDMQMIVVSRLDNKLIVRVDLKAEFAQGNRRKIMMER